ncbi:MLP-like protein 43, major latex protein like 43 [Hibiscus trionum]|uniref:MLP-like protein 43, major latex protein like 43 n=1 Tax=Hibiscus trionum TaxID=183268 RepID=A0A9W7LWH9_HIBTR|nr:MLP-like protein 43, major latex protein like 43 [Hibiscus trionum]
MASSALTGKLEADVEIKATPQQFHDMFTNKPHHVRHTCGDKVQGCELHEGEFGKVGSIITWRYVHDGKPRVSKQVVEAIDPDKNSATFREIEGDMMKEFKTIAATLQASPKSDGSSGCVVHWTLEYEKLHPGIDHPESLFQLVQDITKDIDAHLTGAN